MEDLVMGKRERLSVYEMVEFAIRLIEKDHYPMDVAVGVVLTESLSSEFTDVDQPSMQVFRETLTKAVGAVWGLSAVVEADRVLVKEGTVLIGLEADDI
jgi:hypothetical protein